MMNVIVAGIGTDVGKTVVSAILCEALGADYWKPVQAGNLDESDSDTLENLVTHDKFFVAPEAYRLTEPMSPHAAADIDGVTLDKRRLSTPPEPATRTKPWIVELAGGLMVPLRGDYLCIDLAADLVSKMNANIVLVANYYLGSINHTLLSLNLIEQRHIPLAGIIFNGNKNTQSRDIILQYSGANLLGEIPEATTLNAEFIKKHAKLLQQNPKLA